MRVRQRLNSKYPRTISSSLRYISNVAHIFTAGDNLDQKWTVKFTSVVLHEKVASNCCSSSAEDNKWFLCQIHTLWEYLNYIQEFCEKMGVFQCIVFSLMILLPCVFFILNTFVNNVAYPVNNFQAHVWQVTLQLQMVQAHVWQVTLQLQMVQAHVWKSCICGHLLIWCKFGCFGDIVSVLAITTVAQCF